MKENCIEPLNTSMVCQHQKCQGQLWSSDLPKYVLELENFQRQGIQKNGMTLT